MYNKGIPSRYIDLVHDLYGDINEVLEHGRTSRGLPYYGMTTLGSSTLRLFPFAPVLDELSKVRYCSSMYFTYGFVLWMRLKLKFMLNWSNRDEG